MGCVKEFSINNERPIAVTIPAGIDSDETIVLRGLGGVGKNGGPQGDLLLTVRILPHPLFTRKGTSVFCDMPITFMDATLGAELDAPTIGGRVKLTIPAGTQGGATFRLKGRGIPAVGGNVKGDQFIRVKIEIPTNLNEKHKQALRGFAASTGTNHFPQTKRFNDKVKAL